MSKLILSVLFVLSPIAAMAQSTLGTVLGTVKDNSGAVVPKGKVTLTDTDENVSRSTLTDSKGDYEFVNTKPDHYKVEVVATGFDHYEATSLLLVARQTLRVDVALEVGQVTTAVQVEADAGVIPTDTQAIQSSLDGNALNTLPGNVRGTNGSTSPYALIAALPGVQPDDSGNFSIQGGTQAMAQFSLDGISITNVGGNSPLTDAFPSVESIAEIKVQGSGNNAEFAEVGDVTTISKSGTNEFHGGLFWYHQNAALNATAYGQTTKPSLISNDFGVTSGGPVIIPHIYNGKNRTFYFGTYEGLRLPRSETIQDQVPTAAMRTGDFSASGITVIDPTTGAPFPNDQIPSARISSVANGFLALYPTPNAGDPNSPHAANYIANRDQGVNSDQFDVRGDHYLTSNMSVMGRFSYKNIGQNAPQDLLVPSEHYAINYKLLATSWNWNIRPNLINEFRFGFTLNPSTQTLPFDGAKFTDALGLVGVGPNFPFNGLSEVDMTGYTCLCTDRGNSISQNNTYQWNNNTTWTLGRHTIKFGFDIRRIKAVSALGFLGGDNYGNFNFTGGFTGDAFGDFLLGLPGSTAIDDVVHDNYGLSMQYGVYAQDSFRVSSRLTLEYGLRWEYHPGYTDEYGNIGNFVPVPKSGEVVYPDGAANTLAQVYLQSFNACPALGSTSGPSENGAPCTPVLDASQAGLPQGLRTAPQRVVPRFGFAWRPTSNDKTVIRGGFGMYDTPSMGSIYYALTGTLQSNTATFTNIAANGGPIFSWPNISTGGLGAVAPYGTAYFGTANDPHWKEPYTMQWNLSVDRDLGFNTGLRVSYIGQGTRDLVYAPDLNQSGYSTEFYAEQPLSMRPYPNWGVVNDRAVGANMNYNSLQVEVHHRFQRGLTFDSTYTFAKNLADNQGPAPSSFAGENAGGRSMDAYNIKNEYGPVWGTRRNRWITTAVYELPVGKGRKYMANANRFVDGVLGGWRLSNIFLIQSGPFETPYFSDGDPSGTGSGLIGRPQMPDRLANGSISNPTASMWFNPAAFTCPATPNWTVGTPCTIGDNPASDLAPIGRYGNSGLGVIVGPGTVNLNTALGKSFNVTERVKFKIEASFTNILNHVNLSDPVLAIDNPSVGEITAARKSDFGGYRTGQVSARVDF
ncbi:MAG TPA: TonB-dependent receptor [Bryobacteraceae bacterium]|nr:TonB-dependent receptor [Bryobacteraceae bacterium]